MTSAFRLALPASGALLLLACSPSTSPSDDDGVSTADPSAPSSTAPSQSSNIATPSGSAATPTVEGESARSARDQVPLTPGVYVLAGTQCENPANAAWRVWDGQGLSGSSTRACRAGIISQRGDTFALRNSCENTYDGSRTDEMLAMTVTDQVHFSVKGQSFESCSMAQVPEELRKRVSG